MHFTILHMLCTSILLDVHNYVYTSRIYLMNDIRNRQKKSMNQKYTI